LSLVGAAGFDSACAVGNALASDRDHPLGLSRLMVRAGTDAPPGGAWVSGSGAPGISRRHRGVARGWRPDPPGRPGPPSGGGAPGGPGPYVPKDVPMTGASLRKDMP